MTKLLLGTVLALATSVASAATIIWTPTDSDINYSFDAGTSSDDNLYALFDVTDFDGAQANALVLNKPADTITFTANGFNFDLTSDVTPNTTTLFGNNEFVIATSLDNGISWSDTFTTYELVANTNLYNLTFETGTVLSIDAIPEIQAVPVPAAAWLFGTGLIGIVGIARRKS